MRRRSGTGRSAQLPDASKPSSVIETSILSRGFLSSRRTLLNATPVAVCFRAIVAAEMDLRAALALKSRRSGSRGSGGFNVETG